MKEQIIEEEQIENFEQDVIENVGDEEIEDDFINIVFLYDLQENGIR